MHSRSKFNSGHEQADKPDNLIPIKIFNRKIRKEIRRKKSLKVGKLFL